MKAIKRIIYFLFVMLLLPVWGCGEVKQEENNKEVELKDNQIYIYYVNLEKTDMVKSVYTLDSNDDLSSNVRTLIDHLADVETTAECQSPIPDSFDYMDMPVENVRGRIEVSFNVVYDNIDPETMLFFKGCVSKTLLQLSGVNSVTICMIDKANSDPETASVSESFDEDTFTMSFGNAAGYKQKGNIVLFFANEDGSALKQYRKSVEISNNSSLDRIVMESLIEGPKREGYTRTLSSDTVIKNIAVKDGICYLDLSDEFYNTDNSLKNDIIVYSVVNSLAELPTVSKVQFLHDGEKLQFYRETMPFDGLFERNLDIIEQEDDL